MSSEAHSSCTRGCAAAMARGSEAAAHSSRNAARDSTTLSGSVDAEPSIFDLGTTGRREEGPPQGSTPATVLIAGCRSHRSTILTAAARLRSTAACNRCFAAWLAARTAAAVSSSPASVGNDNFGTSPRGGSELDSVSSGPTRCAASSTTRRLPLAVA